MSRCVAVVVCSGLLAGAAACPGQACAGPPDPPAASAAAPQPAAATPAPVPALAPLAMNSATSCEMPHLRDQILQQLNALRASGATCGTRRMPPAPPVAWNDVLFSAAARHSLDMAERDDFSHVDPRGLGPSQRPTLEGYPWRSMAENIAGGDRSVSSVTGGWQRSTPHCLSMLDPRFTQVGVACVDRPKTHWGTYWTMELGRPR